MKIAVYAQISLSDSVSRKIFVWFVFPVHCAVKKVMEVKQEPISVWDCSVCTFENTDESHTCEMCGAERGK